NPVVETLLHRVPDLGLDQWYLTAGGVFQTIWNVVTGRDPQAGIRDYDIFYFAPGDLSYEAEDAVIRHAHDRFADIAATIEVRNEARVHVWYQHKFGVPARQFGSCEDAIDHFASTTCCYGVTLDSSGTIQVYAPHGFADLFALVVRPNPILAPRAVYETKVARWHEEWPMLRVIPWPDEGDEFGLGG
ncbi:MAG: nucleotidyltransferase family protein, partial [Ktedonobacterales bacterium]|nr:nucleotidyltransferase family protein [Ktedonobacterales bacterium]